MRTFKTIAANKTYVAPQNWDDGKHGACVDLAVYEDGQYFMSWWKPSFLERVKILFGRNLRITLVGGQPPISVEIDPNNLKEVA